MGLDPPAGAAAVLARTVAVDGTQEVGLMDVMQIDFHTTPFRAERFLEHYGPAVSRVLAYGATAYVFFRSEDDPDYFTHLSFWENRNDFERYWFSEEMRAVRRSVAGLHGQPVLPHWGYVVERS